jgi:hypothetical protein
MTDPIVPPVDPSVDPASVPPVDDESDDELDPGADGTPPADETPEQKDARIAALEERNGKLWARLQRAKSKPAPPAAPAPAAPASAAPAAAPAPLTREESILFSQGFTEAQVEQAKKVATLQNLKLTDAVNDPLFTTWKAIEDKKAKDAAAQLPASRGGRPATRKSFATKGLSDEDHKELFNEKVGK